MGGTGSALIHGDMATQTTESKPFTFNKPACQEKIDKVKAHLATFNDKPGHNPFFYLLRVVAPLQTRLDNGETTFELHNEIVKLELPTPDNKFNERFIKIEPTILPALK